MTDRPMVMIYCYDITNNKTRAKVARLLEDQAVRVQASVFETRLTRMAADRLYRAVERLLDPGDSLRMYAVAAPGLDRCQIHGGPPLIDSNQSWIL